MVEKDLTEHYKVLKQFLVISNDQNQKSTSNSSRALRAREKLLKLSTAQFKELSTDVYDELKRRIDESRSEPDYLLPKSTFHPKRNQARQKLSSLPQSRFKDLVSDISLEIERRDLLTLPNQEEKEYSFANESMTSGQSNGKRDDVLDDNGGKGTNVSKQSGEVLNQSLQSKTVVPTKANLTWSSDEEDGNGMEEDVNDARLTNADQVEDVPSTQNDAPKHISKESQDRLRDLEDEIEELRERYSLLQKDYDFSAGQSRKLSEEVEALSEENQKLKFEIQENSAAKKQIIDAGLNEKSNQIESLRTLVATLRLENQSLKNTIPKSDTARSYPNEALPSTRSISNDNQDLKGKLDTMLKRLDDIELVKPPQLRSSLNEFDWQRRYEKLRSKELREKLSVELPSDANLRKFISSSGFIPLKLYSKFATLVEVLVTDLNEGAMKPELLFEKVSKIAIVGNEIAREGEGHLNYNAHATYVRETIAYFITVARYYAIYSSLIPKIIIERSIAELCFSINDLISSAKLSEKETKNFDSKFNGIEENKQIGKKYNYDAPVRPLKMASKLRASRLLQSSNLSLESVGKSPKSELKVSRGPLSSGTSPNKSIPIASKIASSANGQTSNFSYMEASSVFKPKEEAVSGTRESNLSDQDCTVDSVLLVEETHLLRNDSVRSNFEEQERLRDLDDSKRQISLAEGQQYFSDNAEESESRNTSDFSNGQQNEGSELLVDEKQHLSKKFELALAEGKETKWNEEDAKGVSSQVYEHKLPSADASEPPVLKRIEIFQKLGDSKSSEEKNDEKEAGKDDNSVKSITNNVQEDVNQEPIEETPKESGIRGRQFLRSLKSKFTYGSKNTSNDSKTSHLNEGTESKADESSFNKRPENQINDSQDDLDDLNLTEGESFENNYSGTKTPMEEEIPLQSEKNDVQKINFVDANEEAPEKAPVKEKEVAFSNVSVAIPEQQNKYPVTPNESEQKLGDEVNYAGKEIHDESSDDLSTEDDEMVQAKQRQEYRKSMAAATFNINLFDIDDPDNTLTQVLLYLEHQTVQVISTIQSLLSAIKAPKSTRGDLREKSKAICEVISQMTDATNTSMNQTRNAQLKEHGSWVVKSLEDCEHRMNILCKPSVSKNDLEFADKNFKQRLAGISFDIAKCTKELVKTVEEASLKEDIAQLDARLNGSELE